MLDTFRKRDNVRPNAPGQTGARVSPAAPASSQASHPSVGPASRLEPTSPAPIKPALLDTPASSPTPVNPPAASAPVTPEAESAPTEQAGNTQQPSTARLTVGPDIKLKGAEITDCDTLIVEGQVDASMDSRVVEIAENGVFRGKVQVEMAEIRGRFEGELTAHKQLVIRETGRVSGKIRYGKIRIDEGGEVSGDIGSTHGSADSQRNPARVPFAATQTQR